MHKAKNQQETANFSEQYKYPRWQRKRLEILNRDGFTCRCCGDAKTQLHVHHTYYSKGVSVWDHSDFQLITLCEECHATYHQIKQSIISNLGCLLFRNSVEKQSGVRCNDLLLILLLAVDHPEDKQLVKFIKYLRKQDADLRNQYMEMRYGKKVH